MDRYSEYRVMWILVFFDLPTETQKDKKAYVHIPEHTRSLSGSLLGYKTIP